MSNEKDPQELFKMSLSILLAAAVAYGLNLAATSVPEKFTLLWIIASIIIIMGVILLILYFLETKIGSKINILKTFLISAVTVDVFAFSRLSHFANETVGSTTYVKEMYYLVWVITIVIAGILGYLAYLEKKKENKTWGLLAGASVCLLFISIVMIAICDLLIKIEV